MIVNDLLPILEKGTTYGLIIDGKRSKIVYFEQLPYYGNYKVDSINAVRLNFITLIIKKENNYEM